MRAGVFTLMWLASAAVAQATTVTVDDIRPVQSDTTDVFEIFETLQLAQTALELRQYGVAQQGFESVLMHEPNLEPARIGLRQVLIAQGNYQDARNLLGNELSADSIIIRIHTGDIKAPLPLLEKALKSFPDPRLWTLQGKLQDARGDYAIARQSYAMAEMAGARPGLAENNIGQSHWLAGEYDAALNAFNKAKTLDPFDAQFDNNRRRALIQLGRYADAITGLDAQRAGVFLAQAGDKAAQNGDRKLARLLYRKSLDIAPRYNPQVAKKLAALK